MQYEGTCYGGPWNDRNVKAAAPRFEVLVAAGVSVTPPPEDVSFLPFRILGAYVWFNGKEQGETRGEHWQWRGVE